MYFEFYFKSFSCMYRQVVCLSTPVSQTCRKCDGDEEKAHECITFNRVIHSLLEASGWEMDMIHSKSVHNADLKQLEDAQRKNDRLRRRKALLVSQDYITETCMYQKQILFRQNIDLS